MPTHHLLITASELRAIQISSPNNRRPHNPFQHKLLVVEDNKLSAYYS
jgi:hypothetical protein